MSDKPSDQPELGEPTANPERTKVGEPDQRGEPDSRDERHDKTDQPWRQVGDEVREAVEHAGG
ncbi:MAG: hypothetical protein J2O49_04965 [Sciscionella sp.]|nr:hypothetical protein [Sciscionella sp.]